MPIPHAGLIVRKDVFNKMGGFSLKFKIASDFDFVIKLIKSKYKGIALKKCLFNFYMGGVSQNFKIIIENHNVRKEHFNNKIFLVSALFIDSLRYLKYRLINLFHYK
jgi:hypothetical protein